MIVVRVELWSARTGDKTEIARMEIANDGTAGDGGNATRRNYIARTLFGRGKDQLDKRRSHREGDLKNWPSEQVHVWNLVAAVLSRLGYGA